MAGLEVYVGNRSLTYNANALCYSAGNSTILAVYDVRCRGLVGRYVFLHLPGTVRSLQIAQLFVSGTVVTTGTTVACDLWPD
jgi:hypothetical protein